VSKELFRTVLHEELAKVKRFEGDKFDSARDLFDSITTDDQFAEFLTLPAYEKLIGIER
jgi:malate synthase